jgi:hypothetical protein
MQNRRLNSNTPDPDDSTCKHDNIKRESGFYVCQDCGLTLGDDITTLTDNLPFSGAVDIKQKDYEYRIKKFDKSALQDPVIKEKYKKIKKLGKWYKDSKTNFARQKRDIDLLKSYGINITPVQFESIKKRYLSYMKNFKQPFQNMILIFLAIIWDEIGDTTNIRIEMYIEICNEIGHKVNKKMLNNALNKIETIQVKKKKPDKDEEYKRIKKEKQLLKQKLEKKLREQIKFLFERGLNKIPYETVSNFVRDEEDFENVKIQMQLLAHKVLKLIPYRMINSVNIKAFVSGFIYYIAQLGPKKKSLFTQRLISDNKVSGFSATTIRKQYNYIRSFLGDPLEIVF